MTIEEIDQKLKDMRIRYPLVSPEEQEFLKTGAELLKAEKMKLLDEEERKSLGY